MQQRFTQKKVNISSTIACTKHFQKAMGVCLADIIDGGGASQLSYARRRIHVKRQNHRNKQAPPWNLYCIHVLQKLISYSLTTTKQVFHIRGYSIFNPQIELFNPTIPNHPLTNGKFQTKPETTEPTGKFQDMKNH